MADTKPKWRRRAKQRPDQVLDAAKKLFAMKGYGATKIDDIAHEAGLSKGSIYRYFTSKEDIFEALINRAVTPYTDQAIKLMESGSSDPEQAIRAIFQVFAARLSNADSLALPHIVLQEAGRFPRLARLYRDRVMDRYMKALEATITRGIDAGVFRPVNVKLAACNVLGPIFAFYVSEYIFGNRRVTPAATSEFLDNHLEILMHGLKTAD